MTVDMAVVFVFGVGAGITLAAVVLCALVWSTANRVVEDAWARLVRRRGIREVDDTVDVVEGDGTTVALDPEHPVARLAQRQRDAQAAARLRARAAARIRGGRR